MITTVTSREFNQDTGKAKRAAESGPVYITDRGRTAHVLLTFAEFQKLSGQPFVSTFDSLTMERGEEIAFDPLRSRALPREADFA